MYYFLLLPIIGMETKNRHQKHEVNYIKKAK